MYATQMFARVMEPERGRIRPLLERNSRGEIVKPNTDRLLSRLRSNRGQQFAGGLGNGAVDVSAAVAPGTRPDVVGIYMLEYSGLEKVLQSFGFKTITSDGREEILSYPLSSPYPSRQNRGEGPRIEGTDYVSFRIKHYAYALRIGIHVDDIDDDRTGSAMQVIARGAKNFATLPARIFAQIIQGTTDANLLPNIPNCPDGAVMYAATANGANRFGVSGGNLISGTSSPTAIDLRGQFFDVTSRFRLFRDTKNEPLFDPKIIDTDGITIVHGPAIEQEMREAHSQSLTLQTSTSGGSAGDDTAAAAVSNIILESGMKVTLYNDPRITGASCYYFLNSNQVERPIIQSIRRDLYTVVGNEDTSDYARDTNTMFEQSRVRHGYQPSLPLATIKVTNA